MGKKRPRAVQPAGAVTSRSTEEIRMPAENSATAVLWRCRGCGKWSHAQRDPITHKRWQAAPGAATDEDGRAFEGQGWFVWCGPFDRWTAQHDDPKPRTVVYNLGEPVSHIEREIALGMPPVVGPQDDAEIPF